MIKNVLVALVLICSVSSLACAITLNSIDNPSIQSFNWYATDPDTSGYNMAGNFYCDSGETLNLTVITIHHSNQYWYLGNWVSNCEIFNYGAYHPWVTIYQNKYPAAYVSNTLRYGDGTLYEYSLSDGQYWHFTSNTGGSAHRVWGTTTFIYTNQSFDKYTVSGAIECLNPVWVKLFIKNNDTYYSQINYTDATPYNFPILDGFDYRLTFSDNHTYNFSVDGSNVNYDYDDCSHTTYRFEELCGNLIPGSEGFYTEYTNGAWGLPHFFSESGGILDISNSSASKIQIYTTPFSGICGWIIDPVVTDTQYTLINPNIYWGLKVIVQNESDGTLIDGAMVQVNQDCYCTSGTSTRQKWTVSGMAGFIDMSLQDASLLVMKSGYKPINENNTGYSAFLSGRANFSSKTWICKLAPSGSNNSSSFYEVNNTVGIHFVDESGNRTSKIDDTDSEVYLYYENNNTEEEAMTMRFESSSTHTYFMPELQWTIAYDDIGHKTITNSYFTPWDYSYRAVIYNSSIYGWNLTIPLTVRNATKEEEAHYENLSTSIFFMYAHDGKIDYRDTMKIGIHACSNNTTLMTTDIELWKDGVYLCHKNLTASDYTGSSFPYYYIWSPVYDYTSGSNYSVRMYGFDRTLLETDYVECITDSEVRKNKLTIGVKDRSGTNLGNCYIYLEGWGSLPTGSLYYNAYEGIDNGEYRYKASKSGYLAVDGWIDVTIEDGDKIVWYTLIDDSESGAPTQTKMSDDDIKGFFLPLMFMLLICILLGGLRYAAN